jgi:hypothetical protein
VIIRTSFFRPNYTSHKPERQQYRGAGDQTDRNYQTDPEDLPPKPPHLLQNFGSHRGGRKEKSDSDA